MIIQPDKYYTPPELAKGGIPNWGEGSVNTKKMLILRHIKAGKLKARNIQTEKKPRYIILGKDVLEYISKGKLYVINK